MRNRRDRNTGHVAHDLSVSSVSHLPKFRCSGLVVGLVFVGVFCHDRPARAELDNFEIDASIFTKWLYRNNDQAGIVTYGNPFWPENFSGDNGVGSEFEWTITGRPSRWVTAHVRLKSRFGSTWHDFFENGNINYPEENTSAESLGMDHAEYIKLRGYAVDINPPYEWLDTIRIGSSDLGYFNDWTLGRVRYTDRDNAKGVFFLGNLLEGDVGYTIGVVAMPKLWAGPGWSTGVGDVLLTNPFYTLDYAFALHLDAYIEPLDLDLYIDSIFANDFEIDLADPDAEGSLYPTCQDELGDPIPGCQQDGSVDLRNRYLASVTTVQVRFEPVRDFLVDILGGISISQLNPDLATNGVEDNEGVFPMPYDDVVGYSTRARLEMFEPFDLRDFNIRLEYFNIGEDWVSHFATRREADVLLTDGFIPGGQLPTLNIANEFMDFDEPFFESCIGWHGATALFDWVIADVTFELESSFLTYNTNAQDRDVDTVYPDFLHNQGYTDIELYDFANLLDRGRDPRAVYTRNQDRFSIISMLRANWATGFFGLDVEAYLKFIQDDDARSAEIAADDYSGQLLFSGLTFSLPINDEIDIQIGGRVDSWEEINRSGNEAEGWEDYNTLRAMGFGGFTFTFGGARFAYYGEFLHKDLDADEDYTFDIFRSKATFSVAW